MIVRAVTVCGRIFPTADTGALRDACAATASRLGASAADFQSLIVLSLLNAK
jgi:hypothetical protein